MMTSYGRKIYYVNHPALQDKTAFRLSCPNNGREQTIVLGCYRSNQNGIFLLQVTDTRLDGVQQVTAAHEMLHGAYDRLSTQERARIDDLLQNYYKHDVHDQRIIDTINAYKKSEPHDVVNEMHSVFGTEIAHLPTELEQYYQRYFSDRQRVVSYAAQYQSEFTSREATVKQDDATLARLKATIDADQADLKDKQAAINAQQQLLERLRSTNVSAYNAGVPGYNQSIDAYNVEVDALHDLIAQYNQLVTERNAVAGEEVELTQALDAGATPTINK